MGVRELAGSFIVVAGYDEACMVYNTYGVCAERISKTRIHGMK